MVYVHLLFCMFSDILYQEKCYPWCFSTKKSDWAGFELAPALISTTFTIIKIHSIQYSL